MQIVWLNNLQVAAGMAALGARVATVHTFEWGEDVALKGEQTIRDVIDAGGMNPTKKGGPRIKTGEMYSAVDSETIIDGGGADVFAGIGWNKVVPKQAIFQEGGTRRGITPMEAIPMAGLEMETEIMNSGTRMLGQIKAEWNTI